MLLVKRNNIYYWLIFIIISIICIVICKNIKLNQNIIGLLPYKANKTSITYIKKLQLLNKIFIDLGVSNVIPQKLQLSILKKSAELLGNDIKKSNIFTDTFIKLPNNYQLNLIHLLLPYLGNLATNRDLKYINNILKPKYIHKALVTDFTLINMPILPISNIIRIDPLGLSKILISKLESIKPKKNAFINQGFLISKDKKHLLIWTTSKLALTDAKNAEIVNKVLNKFFKKDLSPGVRATVIGALPHTIANSRAIKSDLKRLLPLTSIALLLLFLIFFRDLRLLCAISIPFLCAPIAIIITAIILNWHIYAIALGFGLVLFGIAVDYSVHIYFSLKSTLEPNKLILKKIKKPLISAYLTTIGVFIILLFSEVPSHRQMALLSIIGLTLSFWISWILVPTLIKKPREITHNKKTIIKKINKYKAGSLISIWLVIVIIGFVFWYKLHYNIKLTSLEYIPNYISNNEKIFHKIWGNNSKAILIVVDNNSLLKALDINDAIYNNLKVKHIKLVSISPILPGPLKQYNNLKRWNNFWKQKKDIFCLIKREAKQLGFSPQAFQPFFNIIFHHKILLPKLLLNSDIKLFIKNFIFNIKNHYYILTIISNDHLTKIINKLDLNPCVHIISNTIWQRNIEKLLHKDLLRLSIAAAIMILLIVWIYFKNIWDIIAALSPVIASLSAMSLFNFFTKGNINILNILMGIMIIGLSVDYGIFIVSSFEKEISKSTKIAVTMCALSTLIGFGALALAKHPALKALGTTVLVGILAAWPTAIWITPSILSLAKNGK